MPHLDGLLPDYRQSDVDNAGHGVVIEYPIRGGGLRHVGAGNASPRRSGAGSG